MVQVPRLLLMASRLRGLLALSVGLVGCDAETLGIHVPRGGRAMLHPSVFKRDLWRMTDPRIGGRVPGSSGARRVASYIADRFESHDLKPVFDGTYRRDLGKNVGEMVCGARQGSGEDAIVVAALDPGIGTLSAIPIAGVLSLVATFDAPEAPMHSIYFCVVPEAGGLTRLATRGPVDYQRGLETFIIGTLSGSSLTEEAGPALGPVQSILLHTGPLAIDMSDDIGQLDYRKLTSAVGEVYSRVSAVD